MRQRSGCVIACLGRKRLGDARWRILWTVYREQILRGNEQNRFSPIPAHTVSVSFSCMDPVCGAPCWVVAVSVSLGRAGDSTLAGWVSCPSLPFFPTTCTGFLLLDHFSDGRPQGVPGPFPFPSSSLSSVLHAFC